MIGRASGRDVRQRADDAHAHDAQGGHGRRRADDAREARDARRPRPCTASRPTRRRASRQGSCRGAPLTCDGPRARPRLSRNPSRYPPRVSLPAAIGPWRVTAEMTTARRVRVDAGGQHVRDNVCQTSVLEGVRRGPARRPPCSRSWAATWRRCLGRSHSWRSWATSGIAGTATGANSAPPIWWCWPRPTAC